MNNSILIKSVVELCNYRFYIPSYQRGYRWEKGQIDNLLDDIDEFSPKPINNDPGKTWYCLQPLVLKHSSTTSDVECFEVIDGQQRLTSIYLIINYLNQGYVESRRKKLYQLDYETRENSTDFLKNLDENKIDDTNVDFFYMSKAYQTIHNWFKSKEGQFNINDFESKLLHHTKVIWYETVDDDAIAIFTRINSGKIPLTNSELVKALFLNSTNFTNADSEKLRIKQLEIAGEWDRIEYSLNNPEFWYFINEEENNMPTKIEFILDLIANKTNKADDYFTFRYFSEKFRKCSEKEINENWSEIKRYFQTLEEWFEDRNLYHKIGYLIATGEKIKDLKDLSEQKDKSEFDKDLDTKIKEKLGLKVSELEELEHGNSKIKRVLLLHNIQTMLNNREANSRFPFDRYKKENWDIEHIHSIEEKKPTTPKHQKDWLEEAKKFIKEDNDLKSKIKEPYDFESLYPEILNYFSQNKKHEDINDISNLALLNASINRAYKNAIFPVKRREIIEKDKNGTFIPICTKNIFMKYYTQENIEQMTFWGKEDRENYIENIKETLKIYLKNDE